MGKRNTCEGYLRQHGGRPRDAVTPGVVPSVQIARGLDATLDAGAPTGIFLPLGAIVLKVLVEEVVTAAGGTAPILDIGFNFSGSPTDDPDGLANGLVFDASTITEPGDTLGGVLLGRALAGNGEVTFGDDGVGVNNSSGTIDLYITYTFEDDGVIND